MLSKNRKFWDVTIALRYIPIIKEITKTFKGNLKGSKSILEVGSGEFGISTYISPGHKITAVDTDFGLLRDKSFRAVKGSADKLPFANDSFSVSLSVDMLEHLPRKVREKSVDEMVRVSRDGMYLAFPSGRISTIIDGIISRYYRLTHKQKLAFLDEHKTHGLPGEKEIISYLVKSAKARSKKIKIRTFGNTNALVWLGLLFLGFSEVSPLTSLFRKSLHLLPFLSLINFWPAYRRMVFVEILK